MNVMKLIILLQLTILLIGINSIAQNEKEIWSKTKCSEIFSNESEHFDIIASFLNFLEGCKKMHSESGNKFIEKQIKLINDCIEMPGKLEKNAEKLNITQNLKNKTEKALKECNKTEDVNANETKLALNKQEYGQRLEEVGQGPWKILAFTFIGISVAHCCFPILVP